MLNLLLPFLLLLLTSAITVDNYDQPVNQSLYNCPGEEKNYKIGDRVPVCVHIVPLDQMIYTKIKLDEFSAIKLEGLRLIKERYNYDESLYNSSNFTFSSYLTIQMPGTRLTPALIHFYGKKIVTVFSVVMQIDKGKLDQPEWDNDCWNCDSDHCVDNQKLCMEDFQDKDTTKIYISWMGTDKDEINLISANNRISRFRDYAIGSLYKSATNL